MAHKKIGGIPGPIHANAFAIIDQMNQRQERREWLKKSRQQASKTPKKPKKK